MGVQKGVDSVPGLEPIGDKYVSERDWLLSISRCVTVISEPARTVVVLSFQILHEVEDFSLMWILEWAASLVMAVGEDDFVSYVGSVLWHVVLPMLWVDVVVTGRSSIDAICMSLHLFGSVDDDRCSHRYASWELVSKLYTSQEPGAVILLFPFLMRTCTYHRRVVLDGVVKAFLDQRTIDSVKQTIAKALTHSHMVVDVRDARQITAIIDCVNARRNGDFDELVHTMIDGVRNTARAPRGAVPRHERRAPEIGLSVAGSRGPPGGVSVCANH